MDGLPERFTTREAFDILGWQSSRKGLARHLQAEGFTSALARDATSKAVRIMWQHPAPVMLKESCPCRCRTGTCGAMDLAERSLQLVERLRLSDADTITVLHDLVHRAGVNYAQAALKRISLDTEVPF